MASRLELQTLLETILGTENVYYQPPASVQMKYPAIVYSLSGIESLKANDSKYKINKSYMITYIHKNPDDSITDAIETLSFCRFDRRYVSDNLYHDVFTIYF